MCGGWGVEEAGTDCLRISQEVWDQSTVEETLQKEREGDLPVGEEEPM